MDQSEKYYRRVYCPGHKVSFSVPATSTILCANGGEALAQGFPTESFWSYCCDCRTFWPADFLASDRGRDECPVCNRRTAHRYLCSQCKVLSVGGDQPASRMLSALIAGGELPPPCPGCFRVSKGTRSLHRCPDAAIEFVNTLPSCPFCFETIKQPKEKKIASETKEALEGTIPANIDLTHEVPLQVRQEGRTVYWNSPLSGAAEQTPPPPIPPAIQTTTNIPENGTKGQYVTPGATPLTSSPATPGLWRSRGVRILLAGLVLITLVIIYFAAVVWRLQTQTASNTGVKSQSQIPPMMAYVPGGEFQMGSNDGDEYERPQHIVTLKPFYIDIYEVTCEEYEKFARATGYARPRTWKNGLYPQGAAHWPVTGVTWDDAAAYARWAGKRLPTEEEWEVAARGTDGRRYPWGNDWKRDAANADAGSKGHFTDVGSYPSGKSPFGLFDMSGNAWEWTSSTLSPYPGGQLPQQFAPEEMRVIRSGYWGSPQNKVTATFRRGWPARGDYDYKNTGFRCARDAP